MNWLSFRLAYFSGKDALDKKKYSQAEKQLKKALVLRPSFLESALYLAYTEWSLGKKQEAIVRLQQLIEECPEFSAAHFLLGQFSVENGEIEKGRSLLEKSVELDPKNIEAWYELGKCYIRLNDRTKALFAFRHVADSEPFFVASRLAELKKVKPGAS